MTLLESKLRGKKSTDTFMGKLIKPIYNVSAWEIHILTAFLFCLALYKSKIWNPETRDIIKKVSYFHYKVFKRNISDFFSPETKVVQVSPDAP